MSMLAVGPPGSLLRLPDMYMRRMAVGPRARDSIDLTKPVAENVAAIAQAFDRTRTTSRRSCSTARATTT